MKKIHIIITTDERDIELRFTGEGEGIEEMLRDVDSLIENAESEEENNLPEGVIVEVIRHK